MSQPEIVSRAEVVACLGIGSSITDADSGLIELLKRLVENEARRYCRHDITCPEAVHIHFLPGASVAAEGETLLERDSAGGADRSRRNILQLPYPFVRPESLEVRLDLAAGAGQAEDAFGDETILQVGIDYHLDLDETGLSRSGELIRTGGNWPSRPRTVRVSYFAGFTVSELDGRFSDIKVAILDEVAIRFQAVKSRQSGGGGSIVSESIGGEYSVAYDARVVESAGLSVACRDRLAPYVSLIP